MSFTYTYQRRRNIAWLAQLGHRSAKAGVLSWGQESSFVRLWSPRHWEAGLFFRLDWHQARLSTSSGCPPSLPPWTVSTQITHEKGTSVLGMFLFWGFSFLVVSLALAAPGDDRPIWGGGGASTNKEKDTNLDIRTSGQDTDDTFGLRAGLVNRWEILGS